MIMRYCLYGILITQYGYILHTTNSKYSIVQYFIEHLYHVLYYELSDYNIIILQCDFIVLKKYDKCYNIVAFVQIFSR